MTTQGESTNPTEGLKWATELRDLSEVLRLNPTPLPEEYSRPDRGLTVRFQIEMAVRRERRYISDLVGIDGDLVDTLESEWHVRLYQIEDHVYGFKFLVDE